MRRQRYGCPGHHFHRPVARRGSHPLWAYAHYAHREVLRAGGVCVPFHQWDELPELSPRRRYAALGNNLSAAWATYPKYRDRSGSVESLEKKINDCFERSLNGSPIDSTGREMRAMTAYMRWLAQKVPRNVKPAGSGIMQLPWLRHAADPGRGQLVYMLHCASCHGLDGRGRKAGEEYQYPPLWGRHSFNTGAGIFRISKMAGYIYNNMPWAQPGKSRGLVRTKRGT